MYSDEVGATAVDFTTFVLFAHELSSVVSIVSAVPLDHFCVVAISSRPHLKNY